VFLGFNLTVTNPGNLQSRTVNGRTELYTNTTSAISISTTITFTDGTFTYSFPFSTTGTQVDAFTISLEVPEIDIQRPAGASIADGGTDSQGMQTVGTAVTVTYTVANTGGAPLNVTSITSSNPNNVTVSSISPANFTVGAFASATFDVIYTLMLPGNFSFDLDIASNDANEANYDITVNGSHDNDAVRKRTQRIISNFMLRRTAPCETPLMR